MSVKPDSNFWRDRLVFVTGATGLVGGWLTRFLVDAGADVVCLVRDSVPQSMLYREKTVDCVKMVRGDLCDQALLERILCEYEINTVFHLAAQTIVSIANRNPVSTFESNIRGTWTLLEACRRSPTVKQIVTASSDKAYGDQDVLPYGEDTPLQGRYPYDVSKSCSDLIALSYASSFGLPVAVTRCGNFFGGGDLNWNRLVPGTIRSILRGQRPVIRSDGTLVREYFYVEDGAYTYMALAEALAADHSLAGEAFNFGVDETYTVLELAEKIRTLMASDLELDVRNEVAHEILEQRLDSSKARERLGWTARFSVEEGMRKTIEWYRAFLK